MRAPSQRQGHPRHRPAMLRPELDTLAEAARPGDEAARTLRPGDFRPFFRTDRGSPHRAFDSVAGVATHS
jgi:hypothetical protein